MRYPLSEKARPDGSHPPDRADAVRRGKRSPLRLSPVRQGCRHPARLQPALYRHDGPLGSGGDRRFRQGARSHPVQQRRHLQQFRASANFDRGYGRQRHRLQRRAGSCESRRAGFLHRGFRAQEIAGQAPGLVRKLVLVGTGPRGGEGMASLTPEAQQIFGASYEEPDHLWLAVHFTRSQASQAAGRGFLKRFRLRKENRDPEVNEKVAPAQLEALGKWGIRFKGSYDYLKAVSQPTLVVNGGKDVIVYSVNSFILQQHLPNAQLILYPDANHGSQYQYPELFVRHVSMFLSADERRDV